MVAICATAAVVIAAVVVILTVGLGSPGTPAAHPAPEPPLPKTPLAIPAPATGAYFGAWVNPTMYGQHGHIGAVNALQAQIGRRLDIVHTYLRQPATFPTAQRPGLGPPGQHAPGLLGAERQQGHRGG